jgi:hypothetical protein
MQKANGIFYFLKHKMLLSRTIHRSGNRKRNSGMMKDGVNEYDGKALCFSTAQYLVYVEPILPNSILQDIRNK